MRAVRPRFWLLLVLVCLSVAGCASSQEAVAPGTTVTVTEAPETVTETVSEIEPAPTSPATSTTQFDGDYFSLSYPSDWEVETAEVSKGGYLDTTIRSSYDSNVMVRVDVAPGGGAEPAEAASEVEAYLRPQPGYQRLAYEPSTINGYDGFRWEFSVREHGLDLRKTDTFFTSESGDSYAVLVQAPADDYAAVFAVLEEIVNSLTLPTDAPGLGADEPSAGNGAADTDFCATHSCIANFDNGVGYVVQCADGMWSQSGGRQGACSHHGGVAGGSSDSGYGSDNDPNDDGSPSNWCGASRDGDGDGRWCEGR